jgi:putative ABC transport system permease protein
MLAELLQDLRYAIRLFRRSPGFAFIAVTILALGIGANTAMFSIIHAVLLRPLPYDSPDRLVAVWSRIIAQPNDMPVFTSYRDFQEWRRHSRSLAQVEACTWATPGQTMIWEGKAERVLPIPVSAGFFSMLGVRPIHGRGFDRNDLRAACTVVLSEPFWKDRLGGSPGIVERSLMLDDRACTVVGVMPRSFEFYPRQAELWTLITPQSLYERDPLNSSIGVFARLRPGVDIATARAELMALHSAVVREAPAGSWVGDVEPIINPLQAEFTFLSGGNLRTGLLVLFGAVVCVLLIACVNVANLQLARSAERARELAIRAALGSGRSRLIRQLIAESLMLASAGAVLGAALAFAAVAWFRSASPVELPPGSSVTVSAQVLLFTAAIAIAAGLFSGLLPAWKASRIDLNDVMKEATRGGTAGRASHRITNTFIVAQVALSLTLLAAAGLLIQSIARLSAVPLGFRTDHLLTAKLSWADSADEKPGARAAWLDELSSRLRGRPGIDAIGAFSVAQMNAAVAVAGGAPPTSEIGDATVENISEDYLAVMSIRLIRGRRFLASDRADSTPVAIVNEALVSRYFRGSDPIGRQIRIGGPGTRAPWLTIVGIAGNVRDFYLFNEMAYEAASPLVFLPLRQAVTNNLQLALPFRGSTSDVTSALRADVAALDPGVPLHDVQTMEQQISQALAHPRFRAALLGGFAGLALLLAAIGIYGTLSESVSQRTREIGIRMALGAARHDVLRLVIRRELILTVAGIVLGVAAAVSVTRLLTSMLYGVTPTDPATLLTVLVMLSAVVALACYVPARRATRVDPIVALRDE